MIMEKVKLTLKGSEKSRQKNLEIVNLDQGAIIKTISCWYDNQDKTFSISLNIPKESKEMRETFHKIEGLLTGFELGSENLVNQRDPSQIIAVFITIGEIDPLPKNVIEKVLNFYNITPSDVEIEKIKMKLEQNDHDGALAQALKAASQGVHDAFPILANYYQEKNDFAGYINVLEKIPENDPSFDFAQQEIIKSLNLDVDSLLQSNKTADQKQKEKIKLLEKQFQTAFKAKERTLADHYFNELCGFPSVGSGLISVNMNGDVNKLIEIARDIRGNREEIKALRESKMTNESSKSKDEEDEKGFSSRGPQRFF